jgi:Peptidylarginine deiminase and related enzymes
MTVHRFLPAEWHPQSLVQLTWPDNSTDWKDLLHEVLPCYEAISREISLRQPLLIVTRNRLEVIPWLKNANLANIKIVEMPINDTWARDHGFITLFENNQPLLLDFKFNGWGLKFAADKDNLINARLFNSNIFTQDTIYRNHLNMVLEGGSIESDGEGTILTTSECLLSPNRNGAWSRQQIETELLNIFGALQVLWLDHGFLEGDDTDSHIDTLARLAPDHRILYVQCNDSGDIHYRALKDMESQLLTFTAAHGAPFRLVPLPMCSPIYDEGERLPATYANFLFINGAILVPIYGCSEDQKALEIFKNEFPDYDIIGINCLPLIKQHGSLHCVTMQFPQGVYKK